MRYLRFWWIYTRIATQIAFQTRFGALIFLTGKLMRFFLMFYLIYILASKTGALAGYTTWQIIFFYATFNLIDNIPNLLFREVYRFRTYVVKGHLDYILTKPQSALFRSLFGGSDVLDLPMVILSFGLLFYSAKHLGTLEFGNILLYVLLLLNGLLIAFVFHVFVLCVGILSSEVDNTVMLYRDVTRMGQIPVDVYRMPVSFLITFIIPVGLMMSFPVKALIGILPITLILYSVIFALVLLLISLKFWDFSLKKYQSASS